MKNIVTKKKLFIIKLDIIPLIEQDRLSNAGPKKRRKSWNLNILLKFVIKFTIKTS